MNPDENAPGNELIHGEASANRFFVQSLDQVMIICPACDYRRQISVAEFRNRKHSLKIKCKCGVAFRVHLEFRKHLRKATALQGVCSFDKVRTGGWRVTIINLSLGGICLELRGARKLQQGDRGSLVFTLGDRKETLVMKQVIVRSVSGNRVGCEFVTDRAYEKELGFFLMP